MKIKIKTKNLNQAICSKNNGITLVALIITIIILLILAIVTIVAISKSNIIEKTKTFEGEEKEKVTLAVGSYVEYDVPYTDMFSDIEYTKTTGWRYLGKDDSGNQLIVSTRIPAILNYSSDSNIGNKADGGNNTWWATKAEISSTTDTLYRTDHEYDSSTNIYITDSADPGKYAAYGLRYKFESIPFTYQTRKSNESIANTGIFRKVGNTTSGTDIKLNFRADGVNVVDVHNLTLAEANRAVNSASGSAWSDENCTYGFKDLEGNAEGLFYFQKSSEQDVWAYWLSGAGFRHLGGCDSLEYYESWRRT